MYIEKNRRRWDINSACIVVVLALVFIAEYYMFVFLFLRKLAPIALELTLFLILDIHFFIAMTIWSYIKVASTGPGYLLPSVNENFSNIEHIKNRQKLVLKYRFTKNNPKGAESDRSQESSLSEVDDPESQMELDKIKKLADDPILQMTEYGFCFKCNHVKLPRTHHCRQCGKCVLRMDHHCPWVGNCVGYYNHKFFVLFLGYVAICLVQVFFWELVFFFMGAMDFPDSLNMTESTLIQVNSMSCLALSFAVILLGSVHVYMARKNLTTVEFHVKDIVQRNPFNKGVTRNLEEVFGVDRSTWLLPVPPRLRKEDELFLLQEAV